MSIARDTERINYDSPKTVSRLLVEYGLTTKKRFGQNFLINPDARRRIVDSLRIGGGETIWEIGPGIGSLTHLLLRENVHLTAFEIDRGFIRVLNDLFSLNENLTIVPGDFVHTFKKILGTQGPPDIIVGNLPYRSAAAIFLVLIEAALRPTRIVCTVQKEAADRMIAQPGMPAYSSFSVLCALAWRIRTVGDLKAGSFFPAPKVRSTMLELSPVDEPPRISMGLLMRVTRGLFASRRKTIRNNLKMLAIDCKVDAASLSAAVQESGVNLDARPETLYPDQVVGLALILQRMLPIDKR